MLQLQTTMNVTVTGESAHLILLSLRKAKCIKICLNLQHLHGTYGITIDQGNGFAKS